jgi:putative copper export protein
MDTNTSVFLHNFCFVFAVSFGVVAVTAILVANVVVQSMYVYWNLKYGRYHADRHNQYPILLLPIPFLARHI